MTKILIVEDEAALRDVFSMLFKRNGYDVYEAANGKLALEQMPVTMPDVIILDALMPVMGGIGFLKEADLAANYPATKALMLSNLSDPKTIALSQKLGVRKYILKASVSPGELVQAVQDLLDS